MMKKCIFAAVLLAVVLLSACTKEKAPETVPVAETVPTAETLPPVEERIAPTTVPTEASGETEETVPQWLKNDPCVGWMYETPAG